MLQHSRRRFPSSLVAGLVVIGLAVAAVAVGLRLIGTPFSTRTVDHSPPAVLVNLRDLADYHAGQAQYEVTLDQEHDVRFLPSFVAGDRVQFAAVGTVDAVVDFSGITAADVVASDDGASVVVTLPHARLADPVIDHRQSHVMNRDRGLLNRLGGVFSDNPTSEQGLYRSASEKMAAAAQQGDLVKRAEGNTRVMLTTMLSALGVDHVDVRYQSVA
jgi:hypothetical protein